MTLFLETHNLDHLSPEAIVQAHVRGRGSLDPQGIRYLKHWTDPEAATLHCLVDAPDEDTLRAGQAASERLRAQEIVELFAPAEDWLAVAPAED